MTNLGVMYYEGQSVEINLTNARELFASVAAQGYKAAINGLQVLDKEETRRYSTYMYIHVYVLHVCTRR